MSTVDPPADRPDEETAALSASLEDLGRRIDEAKADAATRAAAERSPRRFPLAWIAVAVLIAVVTGGLVLASGDDDADVASGGTSTTTTATTAPTATTTATSAATDTTAPTATTAPAPPATPATVTTAAPAASTTSPPTTAAPTTTAPPPAPSPPTATSPPSAPPAAGEVTVVAGDSFWRIADRVVSERLGHEATDAEIVSYWSALVAANADRLVQAGNPDLIFPGQVLVLPAPTG